MPYMELTTDTVAHYIKETDELKHRFSNYDELCVTEIGDSNLNYVYLIREPGHPQADLIIKQAVS
jgi:5-methylthioribose kinase